MWIMWDLDTQPRLRGLHFGDDEYLLGKKTQGSTFFVQKIHWLSENTFPETKIVTSPKNSYLRGPQASFLFGVARIL